MTIEARTAREVIPRSLSLSHRHIESKSFFARELIRIIVQNIPLETGM